MARVTGNNPGGSAIKPTGVISFYSQEEKENSVENATLTFLKNETLRRDGVAESSVILQGAGTYKLFAHYSGDQNFLAAIGEAIDAIHVGGLQTELQISGLLKTVYTRELTITAKVVVPNGKTSYPTGQIELRIAGKIYGSQTLIPRSPYSSTVFKLCGLPVGPHSLDFSYVSSSNNFFDSSSSVLAQVDLDFESSLEVISERKDFFTDEDVIVLVHLNRPQTQGVDASGHLITADLCPGSYYENHGSIEAYDSGYLLQKIALDSNYTARMTFKGLLAGFHYLRFVFEDDPNARPHSAEVAIKVNKVLSFLTVESPREAKYGERITFRYTVTASQSGFPISGQVIYGEGDARYPSSAVLIRNGTGVFEHCSLPIGSHLLKFTFTGTGFEPSYSSILIQISRGNSFIEALPVPSPSIVREHVFLRIRVTSPDLCNSNAIGNITLSPAVDIDIPDRYATLKNTDSGIAVFDMSESVKYLPGNHSYTVQYSGDENYFPSSQQFNIQTRKVITAIDLTVSPHLDVADVSEEITFQALVFTETRAPKSLKLRGNVTFAWEGQLLGSIRVSNSIAEVKTSLRFPSPSILVISYLGDSFHSAISTTFRL